MGFIKEFKDFAMRGNLIDFAVGVVVGGAFGKVTTSFVDGIIMPVIGKLIGGQDFSDLKFKIQDGSKAIMDSAGNITTKEVPEVFIKYGEFITTVIDFMAVAFAMFSGDKSNEQIKEQRSGSPCTSPCSY
jgi:large conductance mechanosensitive channel